MTPHPEFVYMVAKERQRALTQAAHVVLPARDSALRRLLRRTPREGLLHRWNGLTIRYANPRDAAALDRLATLADRPLPSGPLLVAEVDGEPTAALGLLEGEFVANPFRPSTDLRSLLKLRASQLGRVDVGAVPRRPIWRESRA